MWPETTLITTDISVEEFQRTSSAYRVACAYIEWSNVSVSKLCLDIACGWGDNGCTRHGIGGVERGNHKR